MNEGDMQLPLSMINEDKAPSKDNERVLYQLLGEIEALRFRRHDDYRDQSHPELKRFTQQELNDEVCPTYKNLLTGRSNRLPNRSMVMGIADYLECSLGERNDLLVAAQYLPEEPVWEGDEWRRALDHAQRTMEALPYPAIVITPAFQFHAANARFLRLFDLPPLEAIPPQQRTMIDLLFNPAFNLQPHAMLDAEAYAMWQKHLIYALQHFQQVNVLYQHNTWYQQLVKRYCAFADFQTYWDKALEATEPQNAPTKMVFARLATTGELRPIRTQHMLVSVSSKTYPAVSALLPVDDAARAVYASFGSLTARG